MNEQENSEVRNTLFVAGGVALMALGAGFLLTHPAVRRTLMASLTPLLPGLQESLKTTVGDRALPDLERYLKLRAM